MKHVLLVLSVVVLLSSAAPSHAFTVSGNLSGGEGGFSLSYVYAVPSSLDTFYIGIGIPIINTYAVLNMQAGSYILFAFQDLNNSLLPDLDEPRGFYGGTPPQFLVIEGDSDGVDIELQEPTSGGFTGTVSYSGTYTGATFIFAHRTPAFTDSVRGIGVLLTNNGNGAYTAFVDSFGTYYARAFMDRNVNFLPDAEDPYGIYGDATPLAINVQPTDFPDEVNIELLDPTSASETPELLPLTTTISDIYPNPFNSRTTISFVLTAPGEIELSLFDLLGREISVLANGGYSAGSHQIHLNADQLPSGFYFVHLQAGEASAARRMLLVK